MRVEFIVGIIVALLAFISLVSSITYYNIKRDEVVKSAVESAIVKGIDPMSVRCVFSPIDTDTLCLVYATSLGKEMKK